MSYWFGTSTNRKYSYGRLDGHNRKGHLLLENINSVPGHLKRCHGNNEKKLRTAPLKNEGMREEKKTNTIIFVGYLYFHLLIAFGPFSSLCRQLLCTIISVQIIKQAHYLPLMNKTKVKYRRKNTSSFWFTVPEASINLSPACPSLQNFSQVVNSHLSRCLRWMRWCCCCSGPRTGTWTYSAGLIALLHMVPIYTHHSFSFAKNWLLT